MNIVVLPKLAVQDFTLLCKGCQRISLERFQAHRQAPDDVWEYEDLFSVTLSEEYN
jgi:hypothetical protein